MWGGGRRERARERVREGVKDGGKEGGKEGGREILACKLHFIRSDLVVESRIFR